MNMKGLVMETRLFLIAVIVVAALVFGIGRVSFAEKNGERIPIWDGDPPDAMGKADADIPTLSVFLPKDAAKPCAAVMVCPGGGYGGLAFDYEGEEIAQWLNSFGVAGFVLKYRLSPYRHPIPMTDAQRALRLIRANAEKWNIDPGRLGVMGFSAGGHLSATVSTHYDKGDPAAKDPVDRQSCRPDFSILCYPVISMTPPHGHAGSRENLLGDKPSEEPSILLSNEKQVTKDTPPAFIFHTADDQIVPVNDSIMYFTALRENGVSAELHVYEHGRHGVGLAQEIPSLKTWPGLLRDWMIMRGIVSAK